MFNNKTSQQIYFDWILKNFHLLRELEGGRAHNVYLKITFSKLY